MSRCGKLPEKSNSIRNSGQTILNAWRCFSTKLASRLDPRKADQPNEKDGTMGTTTRNLEVNVSRTYDVSAEQAWKAFVSREFFAKMGATLADGGHAFEVGGNFKYKIPKGFAGTKPTFAQ